MAILFSSLQKNSYIEESRWNRFIRNLPDYLFPQPISNHFLKDVYSVYIVLCLQFALLPNITFRDLTINFLTPWLITYAVFQPTHKSLVLMSFIAFSLELHSAAPAWLYFTGYWSIVMIVTVLKDAFSWQHVEPWVFSAVIAESWLVCYEQVVKVITLTSYHLSFTDLFFSVFRIVFTGILAIGVYRYSDYCHARKDK